MIHVGKSTNEEPERVIEKASRFFGPQGIGLKIALQDYQSIYFVGAGGHVQVTAKHKQPENDGSKTDVDIQSQVWEKQAKDFLSKIS